jgi:uncharacterized membrane protein YuzA (DUF378 family)
VGPSTIRQGAEGPIVGLVNRDFSTAVLGAKMVGAITYIRTGMAGSFSPQRSTAQVNSINSVIRETRATHHASLDGMRSIATVSNRPSLGRLARGMQQASHGAQRSA